MLYIIVLIIMTFFAVIGLITFINALILGNDLRNEDVKLVLDSLSGNSAERRVRKAVNICEELSCRRLVCECSDEEARFICKKLKERYPIIEIE